MVVLDLQWLAKLVACSVDDERFDDVKDLLGSGPGKGRELDYFESLPGKDDVERMNRYIETLMRYDIAVWMEEEGKKKHVLIPLSLPLRSDEDDH